MADAKRKGLGRGLGALISSPASLDAAPGGREPVPDEPASTGSRRELLQLNPRDVLPNPHQPRTHFDEAALEELAESIRHNGVHQPIVVRRRGDAYEIVSGERRVRASILAEVETVPAVVREVSDEDMLKLGLIENIQREDLNPIELARAYQELADRFGWTQEEIARQVGKKRATVTNTLRLLNLAPEVQEHLIRGDLTMGHARALLAVENPAAQVKACREVLARGMSVRQTENLAAAKTVASKRGASSPATSAKPDAHLAAVEDELRRKFGTRVRITANKEYRGKIELDFYSLEELERILDLLRS